MDFAQLKRLLKYSDRYEISIQFWPGQVAVFIAKDGVDLNSWGDYSGAKSIKSAIEYLDRINKKKP